MSQKPIRRLSNISIGQTGVPWLFPNPSTSKGQRAHECQLWFKPWGNGGATDTPNKIHSFGEEAG